ncbi:TPA: hypothetical protein ACTW9U_002527 [Klebsiella quasipneumoniae subsp. similipneumoniae]|uniref:hypothetical protein n=1 Tax=Gammaproteobacteria TaxID=1236 RepID=UPI0004A116C9|nr:MULTISPECIES: hypothetical protein [Klebsiella]EKZ6664346.1 hypothetical protein [Klebsiella pneumoniae]KDL82764.1 hypothetical protein AD98_02481 [Klebsiella pneumoniae MGH 72]MBD3102575.1 hypothetical protein [Klebsiella pneumoniae]MBK2742253.1 hypothetical protein [Klebsiella pneumoniae]MBK3116850.1 hypothetical protein [Klebsiella pneumoniae]
MSKNTNDKLCLGKPKVIDGSTLAMGLYSKRTGRLGQVLISVNTVAIYGGAVETPPELMGKLKELLTPEKITSFKRQEKNY